jgi:hypothetical protein
MAKYKSNVQSQLAYIKSLNTKYTKKYRMISTSRFNYKGFEEYGIPNDFLEKLLFDNGMAVMTEHNGVIYCLTVGGYKLNSYAIPTSFNCLSSNGDVNIQRDKTNAVLIFDNIDLLPINFYVDNLINDIIEAKLAERLNINALKVPIVYSGSANQELEIRNMANKHGLGMPYLFRINDSSIKKFDEPVTLEQTNPTSYLTDLRDYRNNIHNDMLEVLGINFSPIDKAERVITNEADANNQLLINMLNRAFRIRERAIDEVNKMLGTNITVELNAEVYNEDQIKAVKNADKDKDKNKDTELDDMFKEDL